MKEFNKNYLGKCLLNENDCIEIIVGYDYEKEKYLSKTLDNIKLTEELSPLFKMTKYDVVNHNKVKEFKSYKNELNKISMRINKTNKIYKIYNDILKNLKYEKERNEFKHIFIRISENRNNINSLKELIKSLKKKYYAGDEKCKKHIDFYEDEIRKANKGLRRAYKRLYHFTCKNQYEYIYNFLNSEGNENLFEILRQRERLIKKKEKYINTYNEYIKDTIKNKKEGK